MSHVRKLTLQSNASLQHFPDNTGTNYKVRIDPPIEVDPDDVVGLAVIHFPLQFKLPAVKRKHDDADDADDDDDDDDSEDVAVPKKVKLATNRTRREGQSSPVKTTRSQMDKMTEEHRRLM